jgi:outer membrane protein assembly factor BamB
MRYTWRQKGLIVRATFLAAAVCVVAACAGSGLAASAASGTVTGGPVTGVTVAGSTAATTTAAKYPPAAWGQYNGNAARAGVAPGIATAGKLAVAWSDKLDGQVHAQPLVVGSMVIAATENDSLYALSKTTGKVIWRTHVGTPVPQSALHGCGNIFPLGMTGTPIYDQSDGLVYAVAEITGYHHMLVGVSVTTGAVKIHRYVDVVSKENEPEFYQQRPALAIDNGRVYVSFGGLAGDCGPHVGTIVGVPLSGKGALVSWHTPTIRDGAIWGTGGPVLGPHGDLWLATGEGAVTAPGSPYDGADSVDMLTPTLKRIGYFAPTTWLTDNIHDWDLGSTQPALAAGGSTLIVGKASMGYLLSTTSLGGVGGQLAEAYVCDAEGAAAVNGGMVYEPCQQGGMAAVSVNAKEKKLNVSWRGPASAIGSPAVGGGAVWVTGFTTTSGTLYELNPATGAVRYEIAIGQGLPHFSSLSLAGHMAYLDTLTGITAINGA